MNRPAAAEAVWRDLAQVAAAGLQVPVFLVLSERPGGTSVWLDPAVGAVAGHWQTVSAGEALLPEAAALAGLLAQAMNRVLDSFVYLRAGDAATPGQRNGMVRALQQEVITSWLAGTSPQELNVAVRTWLRCRDAAADPVVDDTATWQAWELVHVLPALSALRTSITVNMQQDDLPDAGPAWRFCGLRGMER